MILVIHWNSNKKDIGRLLKNQYTMLIDILYFGVNDAALEVGGSGGASAKPAAVHLLPRLVHRNRAVCGERHRP